MTQSVFTSLFQIFSIVLCSNVGIEYGSQYAEEYYSDEDDDYIDAKKVKNNIFKTLLTLLFRK